MRVLTYTSYKERYKLYTENHDLIVFNNCLIGHGRKDIILLLYKAVILYRVRALTGVDDSHKKFTLSEDIHSIDKFNTKTKAAVLQQRQDWKATQIKDLNLVIPYH